MSQCRYNGGTKTNNGFNKNEAPEEYERRILQDVAQTVAHFLHFLHTSPNPFGVILLQEVTSSPGLQNAFLQHISTLSHRTLGISVQAVTPAFSNLTIFDMVHFNKNFEWPLGPRLLATELQLKWLRGGRTVRVLNTHLVYVCREGESEEEKAAFKEQVDRVADLVHWSIATGPPGVPVIMAGDFNFDCSHLLPLPQIKQFGPALTIQQIPSSSIYVAPDGVTRVDATSDACISAIGLGHSPNDPTTLPKLINPQIPLHALPGVDPADGRIFFGKSREQFLLDHIHRKLQPEAATLADDRLFHLGKLPFVQQFASIQQLLMTMAPAIGLPVGGKGGGRGGMPSQRLGFGFDGDAAPPAAQSVPPKR